MLDPHADPLRLEDALRQAITLHRRARTLHSELRAAERALAEEDNEANLAWLREVQTSCPRSRVPRPTWTMQEPQGVTDVCMSEWGKLGGSAV